MSIKNRKVVITGAAHGIGKEAALTFAKKGAVTILLDVDQTAVQETQRACAVYCESMCYGLDVTDESQVQTVFDAIIQQVERVDVLINNAGITADAQLINMTGEQFDKVMDVNVKGVFHCTKAVVPYMIDQGVGVIINTSSVVGLYGNFGQTNYAATKAAVIGMTKTWAKELGRKGIRVNAVAPGFILTEMTQAMPSHILDAMKKKTPLQRLGTADDVANVYLFLASDEASFIHGAVLSVDGGIVL